MATLRQMVKRSTITLDSDFDRLDNIIAGMGNTVYVNKPTLSKEEKSNKISVITMDADPIRALRKLRLTLNDDVQQPQVNTNNNGNNNTNNNGNNNTNNNGNNNTNNNGNNNEKKGVFSKIAEWFKNFWKTLWQNVVNLFNTLTGNYDHLVKKCENSDKPVTVKDLENMQAKIIAANAKEAKKQTDTIQKLLKEMGDSFNSKIDNLASKLDGSGKEIANLLKDFFNKIGKVGKKLTDDLKETKGTLETLAKGVEDNNVQNIQLGELGTMLLEICLGGNSSSSIQTKDLDKFYKAAINTLENGKLPMVAISNHEKDFINAINNSSAIKKVNKAGFVLEEINKAIAQVGLPQNPPKGGGNWNNTPLKVMYFDNKNGICKVSGSLVYYANISPTQDADLSADIAVVNFKEIDIQYKEVANPQDNNTNDNTKEEKQDTTTAPATNTNTATTETKTDNTAPAQQAPQTQVTQ